jgi:endonuclease-3 related protein
MDRQRSREQGARSAIARARPLAARKPRRRSAAGLAREVRLAYSVLRSHNGHLHWWPGHTRFEIIVGAILTQNTSWKNVEEAIRRLKAERLLSVAALRKAPRARLEAAIRPSGYFRQKRRKLKEFFALLDREHGGSLARMGRVPTADLRGQLLGTWGIGPETADSILLYAFGRPVFVIDAYTERVARRHGWISGKSTYSDLQRVFIQHVPASACLYNDYHAQLVWVGKHFCRTRPQCTACPLRVLLRKPAR